MRRVSLLCLIYKYLSHQYFVAQIHILTEWRAELLGHVFPVNAVFFIPVVEREVEANN